MRWPTRSGWPSPWSLVVAIGVVIFLVLTAPGLGFDGARLIRNLGSFVAFLGQLFQRPDTAYLPRLFQLLVETVLLAFVSTVFSILVSGPLSFVIARNTGLPAPMRLPIKGVLAVGRAIPDMVWALFMVSAVGLGILPGVLALIITSIVFLAKVYAESIEVVDAKPIEGLKSVGANALAVRMIGVLPQVGPDFVSLSCYMFDVNIRAAAILGLVGAGGIGFDLSQALRLFQYDRLGLILLSVYLLVTIVDRTSGKIQARMAQ